MGNNNKESNRYLLLHNVSLVVAVTMTCLSVVFTVFNWFHSNKKSVETQKRIESTLTYKDVDSTEVLKLINDINEMYKYNERLSDSIDALNFELNAYRNRLGSETQMQIKKELIAKRKEIEAQEEAANKREEEIMAQKQGSKKTIEEIANELDKLEEELKALRATKSPEAIPELKAAEYAKKKKDAKIREEELNTQKQAADMAREKNTKNERKN